MAYDMTLFMTITSASASFVAIVGGFVTSKLISINGERSAVNDHILDLNEMLDLKKRMADSISTSLDEDDALDFICKHIDALSANADLYSIFETDKPQRLSAEEIFLYWEIGLELSKQFHAIIEKPCEINDDNVPVELADKTKDNPFEYSICNMLANNELNGYWAVAKTPKEAENEVQQYNEKMKEYDELLREIAVLELQLEQLKRQKTALIEPDNMSKGIRIFGSISVVNIFLPLLLTLILPHFPSIVYQVAQYACVLFMGIGLFMTLKYMYTLLKWKSDE